MRENDYTGAPLDEDDDSAFLAADIDLYEFDADDPLLEEFGSMADNEQVIHFGEVANGAKSLRDAAERMYDFADELIALSEEGWELVDDVANSHGTAVQFELGEEDD